MAWNRASGHAKKALTRADEGHSVKQWQETRWVSFQIMTSTDTGNRQRFSISRFSFVEVFTVKDYIFIEKE